MIPKIKKIIKLCKQSVENKQLEKKLITIRKEVTELSNRGKKTKKILFGMSFSIHDPCSIHDFLLSQALILRGAEIVPLVCGSLQEGECTVWGGIWGGYTGESNHDIIQSKKNCKKCMRADRRLWNVWAGIESICLSDYIDNSKREKIRSIVDSYNISDYGKWDYEGMPVGQWALDVLRNNALVGDETLVDDYQKKLRAHLFNIVLTTESCKKALREISPNIIVSNDSYYYPWSILQMLAKKNTIPFYSHWGAGRIGSWSYAKGEPAMDINLSEPWKAWKNRILNEKENQVLDEFLTKRPSGKTMLLNTANPRENNRFRVNKESEYIDFSKPTALLPANVIWDSASLNKEVQFKSMLDWICKVIDFFKFNSEFQLIIKAHPTEKNDMLPQTRQLLWDEIVKNYTVLPDNVKFIEPNSNTSVYDIIPHIKVGLVFTSTVGLEMLCYGIPVITAGKSPYYNKGFTYDPKDSVEYFRVLKKLLDGGESKEVIDERIQLARVFFYLYYFHYLTSLNLFDYSFKDNAKLLVSSARDIMPGENKVLDYICDSILNNKPIISENRWPP